MRASLQGLRPTGGALAGGRRCGGCRIPRPRAKRCSGGGATRTRRKGWFGPQASGGAGERRAVGRSGGRLGVILPAEPARGLRRRHGGGGCRGSATPLGGQEGRAARLLRLGRQWGDAIATDEDPLEFGKRWGGSHPLHLGEADVAQHGRLVDEPLHLPARGGD